MKRINILKGIEQILVQKAYEIGHISHRADGDWQKQADGSWKPYAGQSTSQTQEPAPTENTEYGEITEEDLEPSYGDDEVDYTYAEDIDYSQYDDDIKSIEFRENDDGEFEPHDDDYIRVADKIYEQTNREDMSDEEADQLYDEIVDRVIDRAYELNKKDLYSDDESYSDDEESSGSGVYGDIENYDFADLDDYNSMISSAFNAESGIFDDDDELTDIATQYAQDHDIEDTDNNINWIRNEIMGHAERLFADDYGSDNESVGKSAVRDMRSAPAIKNMGF